jgi:hypothetical protein
MQCKTGGMLLCHVPYYTCMVDAMQMIGPEAVDFLFSEASGGKVCLDAVSLAAPLFSSADVEHGLRDVMVKLRTMCHR